ncbi:MAG: hypothetical protein WC047_06360 [Kiritimatiellales bacterium]
MKEKRTYKRFDLIAALAILGCVGMILFEGIFIFELYDRLPLAEQAIPAVEAPVGPAQPADVPPAEIEAAPAVVPVG